MKKILFTLFLFLLFLTETKAQNMEVVGTLKIKGGTPGVGKVLTSDATGLASWVTPVTGSTFVLPYSGSQNVNSGYLFSIRNFSTSTQDGTINAETYSSVYGSAIKGVSYNTTPTSSPSGVQGLNYSTNTNGYGVYGEHFGVGSGVKGQSNNGTGITGESNNGTGGYFYSPFGKALVTYGSLRLGGSGMGTLGANKFLKSINTNGDAEWSDLLPLVNSQNASQNILEITNTNTGGFSTIVGKTSTTGSGSGVEGIATYTGVNSNSRGVTGVNLSTTSTGSGVYGFHAGSGSGVQGNSHDGIGIYGISNDNVGIKGVSTKDNGVFGQTEAGNSRAGVLGKSISEYINSYGVYGVADFGIGVVGYGSRYVGISGTSDTGTGGFFGSDSGYALTTGSGKVGIGTTAPTAKMDIKGSVKFSHFYYGANEDTYIRGGKAGSKVLINDEAGMGSVGIGLLNPNEILDVNGRMRIRHKVISTVPYTSGVWMSNSTNSLSDADGFYGMKTDFETGIFIYGDWRFWVNGAGNGYLNGNLIQTSDQRLKKNFLPIKNSLSSIYKLNGYKFNWIEEARSKDLQTGLIAQEVQKIFPELVQTDEKGFLSVNYIGLVPHLIEAVKELRDENNSLKLKNKTLETKNQTLESRLDKIEAMLSTIQPNTENSNSKK